MGIFALYPKRRTSVAENWHTAMRGDRTLAELAEMLSIVDCACSVTGGEA